MKFQKPRTLVTLLRTQMDVAIQLHWAVHLANARKMNLLILHRVESQNEHVVEAPLNEPPKAEEINIIQEVRSIIENSPVLRAGSGESSEPAEGKETEEHVIEVRLKLIYFERVSSLRRAILAELGKEEVEVFTQARSEIVDMSDVDLIRERRLFFRYIPCKVVLCLNLKEDNPLSRILVATAPGPNGRAALQLGKDLAASVNGSMTALQVNPPVGIDEERIGMRRLERHIGRSLDKEHSAIKRRVVVDDKVRQGIRRVWEEDDHDLVVVGVSPSRIEGGLGTKLGQNVPVVMVSPASPFANRFKQFMEEGIKRFVPQIEREDRVALVDRIQSSAAWNFDFISLMVLSTVMAAVGLIQNSAAVVIGAMLVAPLMTPLLGIGLALVHGNPVLARLSLKSVARGLCVSLLGGFLVGLCTLGFEEPTREMLSRGGPGFLDLCVAFAAGLAAAYASSRPGLIAALPGVAIAAALVPPIATSGLAFSIGDFPLATGSLLLFGINMVTIILASMVSLWLVGLRSMKKTSTWTTVSGGVVIASVLALGLYLSFRPVEYELAEDIPQGLATTVQKSLGTAYSLEGLAVAYDELGLQLNVQVAGRKPVRKGLATAVRTLISDHYDKPVRVRLLTRIDSNMEEKE